jgi:hypothetical protein
MSFQVTIPTGTLLSSKPGSSHPHHRERPARGVSRSAQPSGTVSPSAEQLLDEAEERRADAYQAYRARMNTAAARRAPVPSDPSWLKSPWRPSSWPRPNNGSRRWWQKRNNVSLLKGRASGNSH